METHNERLILIESYIQTNKVCKFKDILKIIDCSLITLRRDIAQLKGITSYTHQGQFISIPSIPVFDKFGIWFYNNIGFTKYGNSLELIINIINKSEKGITKEHLEEIMGIKISQQIQVLLQRNRLNRVKVGNKYCYISEKLAKNKIQRIKLLDTNQLEEYYDEKVKISDLIAVLKIALLESKIEIRALGKLINKYSLTVPIKKIEQLLLKYNLFKKKAP